ncbi:MAG TPA: hydroxysqualene dehydroxylase HpnE [Acidimicrobiales bacterium]|nr:hydroxysqualene dehydroxylase HpnE [Acidimicrobiales bacterium]
MKIGVVGGGLAGMAAALACADAGAEVTLFEKRARLGGLTWSFEHGGLTMDNGQHVFLRCCTAYLEFLRRIGSSADVSLQDRLDVTVIRNGKRARLARNSLPAPFHLAQSLLGYSLVPLAQRARLGLAAAALARLDLDDPALDDQTFEQWLRRHHQGSEAITELWDLICLATVNVPASAASLAMAAKVFQTGLLTSAPAGDIGWSLLPLGELHGRRGKMALEHSGVHVRMGDGVESVAQVEEGWVLRTSTGELAVDAVVVALPHYLVEGVLPVAALQSNPSVLGSSPIVNVHVHFDRRVTTLPLAAGDGFAQWVFDRTASSGAGRGQYLAVSVSGADDYIGRRPEELGRMAVDALTAMFPLARSAQVLSSFVTREHNATYRAVPGSGRERSSPRSRLAGLAIAGAWTSTGWPPTMEGAVRSGNAAANAALAAARARHGYSAPTKMHASTGTYAGTGSAASTQSSTSGPGLPPAQGLLPTPALAQEDS